MSTGYTAKIEKGISFQEYAFTCARAFGALISMRDNSMDDKIPDKIEPSDYHLKALEEVKNELKMLKSLSLEEVEKQAKKAFQDSVDYYEESIQKAAELKKKYMDMLSKVNIWQPPTQEHVELKNFMKQQIEISIDSDCSMCLTAPSLISGKEWLNIKIASCLQNIAYHTEKNKEEIERANNRTQWIQALKKSLERERPEKKLPKPWGTNIKRA